MTALGTYHLKTLAGIFNPPDTVAGEREQEMPRGFGLHKT